MWQHRACFEQSNVLDVTIQCQFNVSAKNASEYSSTYSPNPGFQTSMNQDDCFYNNRTPKRQQFSYDSCNYGFNDFSDHLNPMNGSGDCAVSRTCLEDSGYGSPLQGFAQQKFGPCSQTITRESDMCSVSSVDTSMFNHFNPVNGTYYQAASPNVQTPGVSSEDMKIAMREKDVMQRIFSLRAAEIDGVDDVEKYFQSQTTVIDNERHRVLCQMSYDKRCKDSVQRYYNRKLSFLLESVEAKLVTLESKKSVGGKSRQKNALADKRSRLLPKSAVKLMETWYNENLENPYPSRETTLNMASEGGITVEQIRKWFANKRNRSRNDQLKASDACLDS